MSRSIIILVLGVAPCLISITYWLSRRYYDKFEPYTFVTLYGAFFPSISAFHLAIVDGSSQSYYFLSADSEFLWNYLLAGLTYISSFGAVTMGYACGARRLRSIERGSTGFARLSGTKVYIAVALLSLVSAWAIFEFSAPFIGESGQLQQISGKRFVEIDGSEFQGSMSYLRWFSSFAAIGWVLLIAYFLTLPDRLRIRHWIIFFLVGIIAFSLPVFASSRTDVVALLISALIVFHYTTRRISFVAALSLGAVGIAIIVVMGILRSGPMPASEALSSYTPQKAVEMIGGRSSSGYANLANVITAVPDNWDYQLGSTYAAWLVAPIPRSIWPQKPPNSLGDIAKSKLYNKPQSAGGDPLGSIAELYLNFGWLGLLAAPVFWFFGGFWLRVVYTSIQPLKRTGPGALTVYALVIPYSLPYIIFGSFSKSMVNMIMVALPTLLTVIFVSKRRSRCMSYGGRGIGVGERCDVYNWRDAQ